MNQDVTLAQQSVLLVFEAFADINSGRVVGPNGPRFIRGDISKLSKLSTAAASRTIMALEKAGYIRIIRHRYQGQGSEYFLTNPGSLEHEGGSLEHGPRITGARGWITGAHDVSPCLPYISPSSPPERREEVKKSSSTAEEYDATIQESIRQYEDNHADSKNDS